MWLLSLLYVLYNGTYEPIVQMRRLRVRKHQVLLQKQQLLLLLSLPR